MVVVVVVVVGGMVVVVVLVVVVVVGMGFNIWREFVVVGGSDPKAVPMKTPRIIARVSSSMNIAFLEISFL